MVYESLLTLYFPRSASEEHDAAKLLPLAQRSPAVQPTKGPSAGTAPEEGKALGARLGHLASSSWDPNPALAGLTQPPKPHVSNGAPSGLAGGAAATAVLDAAASVATSNEAILRGSAYASFLQRAGLADLSDIESMQLFYRGGVDARGRPIFLFWAGHLPSRPVDLERVLMHLMRTLDAHVHAGYIIIYIHTTLSPENEPPFAWLRKVYDLFDQRLKDNLHLMYVVHASWWLKMAMNFLRTFVASGRWWDSKVIQLTNLVRANGRIYFLRKRAAPWAAMPSRCLGRLAGLTRCLVSLASAHPRCIAALHCSCRRTSSN